MKFIIMQFSPRSVFTPFRAKDYYCCCCCCCYYYYYYYYYYYLLVSAHAYEFTL
jgi:hypothetical protein